MTDTEAFEILRAQGHSTGTSDRYTGRVTLWVRGTAEPLEVQTGRELQELAAGRLALDDIRAWREDEAAVRRR